MKHVGIILAGGSGNRLKSVTQDKALLRIGAGAVISWSVVVFHQAGLFDELVIVHRDEEQKTKIEDELKQCLKESLPIKWVTGGARRQDSVMNALRMINDSEKVVFVHDSARPFITPQDLQNLSRAVSKTGAATMATKVTDTIKQADRTGDLENLQLEDLNRDTLYAMATPQVFKTKNLLEAYEQIEDLEKEVTDCVAAYQLEKRGVSLVLPQQNNFKITNPEDVELANFLIHTGSIQKVFELAYS